MNVEIGTVAAQFQEKEYLFREFSVLVLCSVDTACYPDNLERL
jgi:hypothetical protein